MRKRKSGTELVEDEVNLEDDKKKTSIHSLSAVYAVYVIGYIIALHYIVSYMDQRLPKPLKIKDEVKYPDSFIAERAKNNLRVLTEIGPKVVGSYDNEVLAIRFLLSEIDDIIEQDDYNRIDVSLQQVSGSYYLAFKPQALINAYGNVQNVVVKFSTNGNKNKSAILINSHFDTVPTSPGGSDDGIMVVTMLEVLRKLIKSNVNYEHDIIFLFNGAEESVLQASHGFITQHEWHKNVKVIINLEAAGAGSKEILFQSGPGRSWLLNYYGKVPHPHGQVAGEEIFQSNLIPSDTDFRIFRDFGKLYGYDFAFYRNGYRYHTKYDNYVNIPYGSYQHVGDNVLTLVKELANSKELNEDNVNNVDDKMIYYDFLGLFLVHYDITVMYVVNLIVCLTSLVVTLYAFVRFKGGVSGYMYVFFAMASIMCGWMLAIAFNFLTATLIDFFAVTMSWYGNPWLIYGLYYLPGFVFVSIPLVTLNHFYRDKYSMAVQSQVQLHLIRLVFTGLLFIGTLMSVRATYALMVPVLFNTIIALIVVAFKLEYGVWGWRILQIVGNAIPTIFIVYMHVILFGLVIPICGRIGSDKNPEIIVGMLSTLFTILISSYYVNFYVLMGRAHRFLVIIFVVFLIFFVMVLVRYPFPYSDNLKSPKPQRYWLTHTNRKFHAANGTTYKEDNGYFALNMDRNSPSVVEEYVATLKRSVSIVDDCNRHLYCGLPLQHSRMAQIMKSSSWIPTDDQPIIHPPAQLKLNEKVSIGNNLIRYNVTAIGPDHMTIFFAVKEGGKMRAISLLPSTTKIEWDKWKGQELVFVKYTYGRDETPLNFHFDVETTRKIDVPMVEIVLCGQYMHDYQNTKSFDRMLSQFPKWADVTPALATYESWFI